MNVSLSLSQLAGRTGRGVCVAVVDSGIHAEHPHVGGVAGGAAFDEQGRQSADFSDRLGHGTAVAGAIREKAPLSTLLSVRVFDRSLATSGGALVSAIRWSADQAAALINLSLGTLNPDHADALTDAIAYAALKGAVVVTAAPQEGQHWLPGALGGVVAVEVDWSCPRDRCVVSVDQGPSLTLRASGYPRPIPGQPPERNVRGQSFAVANATGILALQLEGRPTGSLDALRQVLQGSAGWKTL
jgi:subtilisin family serine protease